MPREHCKNAARFWLSNLDAKEHRKISAEQLRYPDNTTRFRLSNSDAVRRLQILGWAVSLRISGRRQKPEISEFYQVHARRSLSAYILFCHPIIHIQSAFDTIQHLLLSSQDDHHMRGCRLPENLGETPKARNLRDYGNLSGACQKVIECLYTILSSSNEYWITLWHNSALAFIFGWCQYTGRVCRLPDNHWIQQ